jgi:regulation of enolase protein 1 (concanavalin A-like superfamily)
MKKTRILTIAIGFLIVVTTLIWNGFTPIRQSIAAPAAEPLESSTSTPTLGNPVATQVSTTDTADNSDSLSQSSSKIPDIARKEFGTWAENYLRAGSNEERGAMVAMGVELAANRRVEMKNLIVSDPQQAIRSTVPYEVRSQLPQRVVDRLEVPVNALGEYLVEAVVPEQGRKLMGLPIIRTAKIPGETYRVHAFSDGLQRPTRADVPIHGIAVDGELALNPTPYRRLPRAEVVYRQSKGEANETCPVSGDSVVDREDEVPAVDIGGKILVTCQEAHVADWIAAANGAAGAGSGGEGSAPLAAAISGPKTFLYMRVRFSDQGAAYEPQSLASANQQAIDANNFLTEASLGATTLAITNTPVLTLPNTEAYYVGAGWASILADARVVAAGAGFSTANYDYDGVRYNGQPGDFGGIGYIGTKGLAVKYDGVELFCHEYGHNMGVWHANHWLPMGASAIGVGWNSEYGDAFDVMGGMNGGMRMHYNGYFKYLLGWIPIANVQTAASTAGTKNTYRVHANDLGGAINPALNYAVRITKDIDRDYWVTFRQHALWGTGSQITNGAELHWDAWGLSNGGSHLIDTTPGSNGGNSDCVILPGRTFSDPTADIHFTVLQKIAAGGGAPPALDVVVAKGPFAGNLPPSVTITAVPANPTPGQSVTLSATASDPNGDPLSYCWETGAAINMNASSVSTSWSLPGWKRVTCTVSDMKGMTHVATLNVQVGAPAPAPWTASEVGLTGIEGGDSYDAATGTITVHASGADIYGIQDEFRFVYQTMKGDGEIVARVKGYPLSPTSKAGVMIRQNLTAGSANMFMGMCVGKGLLSYRVVADQATGYTQSAAVATPYWIKLIRTGNQISGWMAPDSSGNPGSWSQLGGTQSIAFSEDVCVGLALASYDDSVVTQATFDNVKVTSAPAVVPKYFAANSSMGNGTLIGTATATGTITGWSIVGGNTGNAFTINASGQVTLATPAALPNPGTIQLIVRTTNITGGTADGIVNIACNEFSLRAWWRLDETSGVSADDSSGAYDGTLLNAPTWTPGYSGGSLAFNGTTQSVQLPDLGLNTNNLTISAWVKRNGTQSAWAGIAYARTAAPCGLGFGPSNDLRYTWAGGGYQFASDLTVPDNIWTFCAVVIEPTKATLYMKPAGGAMQMAVNAVSNPVGVIGTNLYLGQDSIGGRFFKGQLDEVRIHNRILTPADLDQPMTAPTVILTSPAANADISTPGSVAITAAVSGSAQPITAVEFYRGGTLIGTDSSAPYGVTWSNAALGGYVLKARAIYSGGAMDSPGVAVNVVLAPNGDVDGDGFNNALEIAVGTDPNNASSQPASLYSGLRAWWKLDETGGTSAKDSSGNLPNATVVNSPPWVAGKAGNGLSLNGAGQAVYLPDIGIDSNQVTISAWVKRNGTQTAWTGILYSRGGVANGLHFGPSNDLRYTWSGAANYGYLFASNLTIPDNTWTFCAVVIEPSKATLYMRPEGGTMATAVNAVSHSASTLDFGAYIGWDPGTVPASRYFNGTIDDVHIYNRTLSAADVTFLHNEALPPQPPAFTTDPIAGAGATEDAAYSGTLAGSATDPNAGPPLTYSKVGGPFWLSVASNGTLGGTPSNGNVGPNSFTVRVTDSTGLTDEAALNIIVANTNDAPTFASNPLTKPGATIGSAYSASIAGDALDVDTGDTRTFSKTSGNSWLTVTADGALSGTPPSGTSGVNSFTVRVTDAGGLFTQTTLNITVSSSDPDGDGLTNGQESTLGTNPNLADTDGDGFSDGFEVAQSSNPLDSSSEPDVLAAAHWDFNDNSTPSISRDRIGAVPGTLTSGAVLSESGTGRSGQAGDRALDLGNTGTGQRLEIANVAFLQQVAQNNQLTLSFWQKLDTTGVGMCSLWAVSPTSGDGQRGISAHAPWSNGTVYFDCGNATTNRISGTPSGVVWTNWNHIALVRNGGTAEIWINGNLLESGTNLSELATDFTLLCLGSANGGTYGMRGKLDDFAVFRTPLSAVQIASLAGGAAPGEIYENHAPVFAADPMNSGSATENSAYSGTLAGSASDIDSGDTLTYSKVSGPSWLGVASNGMLSGTPGNGSAGPNSFIVRVTDTLGLSDEATLNITVSSPLPSGWTSADIGSVGVAGSTSESGGTYTVSGSGADIFGTADAFQFASQTLVGDGEIRARVTSQSNPGSAPKAGVMIRSGTGAGAVNAMASVTPSGFHFQYRATASATSSVTYGPVLNSAPNNWIRLTRSGNILTAYHSANGTAWIKMGSSTIAMASSVTIGLAVCSKDNGVLSTATFDNMSVTPFPSPWQTSDLGTTNLAGSAEYFGSAYTVKGAGTIGGTTDGFRYVYQNLSGDGSIVARVNTLQNTGTNSRIGVMIRDTLTSNSRMAALTVSDSGAWRWQRRTTAGGSVTSTNSSSGTAPNLWVRLVRSGNTITASRGTNGTTWTTISSVNVTMAGNCYIGLCVASGSTTTLNTSVIDNVTVAP